MGGKSPTAISFANTGKKIFFLDTIKYFQQSLGGLANGLIDQEKSAISRECEKLIKNDSKLPKKYLLCTKKKQKWILQYLSTEKGTVPYEMITSHDSLGITPENGKFFLPNQFCSNL